MSDHPVDTSPASRRVPERRRNVIVWIAVLLVVIAGVAVYLATTGSAEAITYDDPQALVSAMADEGLECSGVQEVQGSDEEAPFRAATCTLEGREMAISVSKTRELPASYGQLFQEYDTGQPAVVGPNWVVEAPYDELSVAEDVQGALGGEILESHLTGKE